MRDMWLKRVLIPFWTIQLIFLLVIHGFAAYSIKFYHQIDDSYDANLIDIGGIIMICFSIACIVFNIVEIVMFARHRLLPLMVVIFSCIMTVLWLVYFLSAILSVNGNGVLAIVLGVCLFLTALGQLIYSSIVYHRYRKGYFRKGAYAPTAGGARTDSPPPTSSYAACSHGPAPRHDPFRDPSPAPSCNSAAMHTEATHPALRQNGPAGELYGGQQSYDLAGLR